MIIKRKGKNSLFFMRIKYDDGEMFKLDRLKARTFGINKYRNGRRVYK